MRAGLKAPHGITLVIGDAGAGKTPLLRAFTAQLRDACAVAFLPSTGPGLRHLLTEIIDQLGASAPPTGEEQALVDALRAAARAATERGRTTVVVVDDAHDLPAKTIERLGKLFGDDAAEPSGLHIILVGRPELLDRMNAANDRSILKHLVQVCRMDPIGPDEALRYISDRLARVGGLVDHVFTRDAVRLIVNRAGGNPHRIDELCAAAMEHAEMNGALPAGPDVVDRACTPEVGSNGNGYSLDLNEHDSDSTGTGGYVFDEDQSDDGSDADKPMQRPQRKKARPRRESSKAKSAGFMARVTGTRRSLVLAGLGLVGVLAFFAMTMTDTDSGPVAQAPPAVAVAKAAKATTRSAEGEKSKAGATGASNRGDAKNDAARKGHQRADVSSQQSPLPAKPVATPKLVVKRTPPAGSPAVEAAPIKASSASSEAQAVRSQRETAAPVHAVGRQKPEIEPVSRPAAVVPAPAEASARPDPTALPPTMASASPQAPSVASSPAVPVPVQSRPGPLAEPAAQQAVARPSEPSTRPIVAMPTRPSPPAAAPAAPNRVASTRPPPAVASGPSYSVQIGAFKSRSNAEQVLVRLQGRYPDGRIVDAMSGDSPVFRVMSGAFASKVDADRRAGDLARNGFSTFVRRNP